MSVEILQKWETAINESNEFLKSIDFLDLSPESPLYATIWKLQDVLTEFASARVGDDSEWLDWYRLDNDMGKNEMEAGYKDSLHPVKNLDDLQKLLYNSSSEKK
jgi:hypothetical protein